MFNVPLLYIIFFKFGIAISDGNITAMVTPKQGPFMPEWQICCPEKAKTLLLLIFATKAGKLNKKSRVLENFVQDDFILGQLHELILSLLSTEQAVLVFSNEGLRLEHERTIRLLQEEIQAEVKTQILQLDYV